MPIYCWENDATGQQVEVIRHFNEYTEGPTEDEIEKALGDIPASTAWHRVVSGNIRVTKSSAWGSGKGYYNNQRPSKYVKRTT